MADTSSYDGVTALKLACVPCILTLRIDGEVGIPRDETSSCVDERLLKLIRVELVTVILVERGDSHDGDRDISIVGMRC